MKKILTLQILILSFFILNGAPPDYLWVGTYTIGDYHSSSDSDMRNTYGQVFASTFLNSVGNKYPSVQTKHEHDLKDSQVRANLFTNQTWDGMPICDIVFFSGHGSKDGIWTWNNTGNGESFVRHAPYTSGGWGYGYDWTKWVIQYDCLTLHNTDASRYEDLFQGMHAILGYRCVTYNYESSYDCQFPWWCFLNPLSVSCIVGIANPNCKVARSKDIMSEFAKEWVERDRTIWDAWKNANYNIHYKKYTQGVGGKGIDPAIVSIYGRFIYPAVIQGFNGASEKFDDVKDFMIPAASTQIDANLQWVYEGLSHYNAVYGSPKY